jgi:uncharacterized protein (DUF4415 family)
MTAFALSACAKQPNMSKTVMAVKRYTEQELKAKQSATDWEAVNDLTDEEIYQAALSDPDNPPLTEQQLKQMRPLAEVLPHLAKKTQPKIATTLTLSPEVLAYFKAQGSVAKPKVVLNR